MSNANVCSSIRDLLSRDQWYSAYEITGYLQIACKTLISESACTARVRDLRKPSYGRLNVKSRPRKGSTAWEYRIEQAEQKAA